MCDFFSLFVDPDLPSDQKTLNLFMKSNIPGVVIPTIGVDDAYLRSGETNIRGNKAIRAFLEKFSG